jgi:hypothetical protein
MEDKKKQPVETAGGFNPARPEPPSIQTVGPLPTGDPNGKATPALKEELKRAADQKQRNS